ncbi:MAG: hypothetical protein PUB07_02070 [Clostridia bacterium]|nr:hypothetical protein [Clostridia bacterium]
MKDMLKKLAAIPSPSGTEDAMRNTLQAYLKDLDTTIDAHGSLIVHKKGEGEGIVVLAAMDTPSLFVTAADKGFSRFSPTDELTVPDGTIVQFTDGIVGVVSKDDAGQFIDTGDVPVPIGAGAAPLPSVWEIGATRLCGFALGNYAALTACLSAALEKTTKDVYYVFAAKTCIRQFSPAFMQKVKANLLISVEVSAANDYPEEKAVFLSLGQGTSLRIKDKNMLSAPDAIAYLSALPVSTVREVSMRRGIGGTVQKAFGGIKSVGIGIPTRYADTLGEMVDMKDIENTKNLLLACLSN